MSKRIFAAAMLAATSLVSAVPASAQQRIQFEYWYGLTGRLGEIMEEHCKRFNDSQTKYEAKCIGQGGYDKAEQNAIAAYRASSDESARAPVCQLNAPEDEIAARIQIGSRRNATGRMIRGKVEDRCHLALGLPVAHEAAIATAAQCQRKSVEQDGFAGARLAGQHH